MSRLADATQCMQDLARAGRGRARILLIGRARPPLQGFRI
jgi:hypothetical protein